MSGPFRREDEPEIDFTRALAGFDKRSRAIVRRRGGIAATLEIPGTGDVLDKGLSPSNTNGVRATVLYGRRAPLSLSWVRLFAWDRHYSA